MNDAMLVFKTALWFPRKLRVASDLELGKAWKIQGKKWSKESGKSQGVLVLFFKSHGKSHFQQFGRSNTPKRSCTLYMETELTLYIKLQFTFISVEDLERFFPNLLVRPSGSNKMAVVLKVMLQSK